MKRSMVLGSLLMVAIGCHSTEISVKDSSKMVGASEEDCNNIYSRILAIALYEDVPQDSRITSEEIRDLARSFDDYYKSRGVTQAFYSSCIGKYNHEQVVCMSHSETLEAMGMCAKMFAAPKPIGEQL